jgi:hypothetical protein
VAGAGLAVILSTLGMLVMWYVRTSKLLEPGIKDWIGAFGPPVVASTVLVGSLYVFGLLTRPLFPETLGGQIVWFVAIACVGMASYIGAFLVGQPRMSDHHVLKDIAQALRS